MTSIVETNYFKVDIQYLQKSSLLVAAKSLDEAQTIVKNNIADGIEQFEIVDARELDDTEKAEVIARMTGLPTEPEDEFEEIPAAETRTLN